MRRLKKPTSAMLIAIMLLSNSQSLVSYAKEEVSDKELDNANFTVVEDYQGSDVTAPEFKSISVDKKVVKPGDKVTISIDMIDNQSGIDLDREVYIEIGGENSNQLSSPELLYNEESKKYEFTIEIDGTMPNGIYSISEIYVFDKAGNSASFGVYGENPTDLSDANFEVVDNINGYEDLIKSVNIDNKKPKFGDTINISVELTNNSYIGELEIFYNKEKSVKLIYNEVKNRYEGSLIIDKSNELGIWSAEHIEFTSNSGKWITDLDVEYYGLKDKFEFEVVSNQDQDKPINRAPEIIANDVEIKVGEKFDAKKLASAKDYEDGDITGKLEILEDTVDTSTAGVYKVVYKVTDSQGLSTTKEIKVKVESIKYGWVYENGKWYYYNQNGEMKTGWLKLDGIWYYLRSNGEMAIGWELVGGKWYYLKDSGAMKTGWLNLSGKWYYLEGSGAMKTGWLNSNGTWYYLRNNGEMSTGWEKVRNKWYYLVSSGAMKTGWLDLNGTWYYLNSSGEMAIGWKKLGYKWYYLEGNGAMKTGWLNDNGTWYYLNKSGEMLVNSNVDGWDINDKGVATLFTYSSIPKHIRNKMLGNSLPQGVEIGFDDLSYLQLTYYGFDNKTHTGEMIVSNKVAKEVVDIFKELYQKKYPIEKIRLIDEYYANDSLSMKDNNSSAFCYRKIAGSNKLSNHGKGLAIDINPIQNPHVKGTEVSPVEGKEYINRKNIRKGMIIKGDEAYKAFTKRGWKWGGNWNNPDYQHFEKNI